MNTAFFSICSFLTGSLSLVLGLFVLFKQERKNTSYEFFLMTLAIAAWSISLGFEVIATNPDRALLLSRVMHYGVIFISPTYLQFCTSVIKKPKSKLVIFSYLLTVPLIILNLSGSLVPSVSPKSYFSFYTNPGVSYYFLLAHFFIFSFLGTTLLIMKLRETNDELLKNQIRYVLLASFFGFAGGSATYLPVFGIQIPPFAMLLVATYTLMLSYGIIKHKLLNVDVFIRRTTIFAGLFAFVYGTFAAFTVISQHIFENLAGWNLWVSMIPTICIITFALRPIENILTSATDKYLFQKKFNYRELLKTFTTEILTVLDFQKLLNSTTEGLRRIMKLECCGILILDPVNNSYILKASSGIQEDVVLSVDSPLIYYLNLSQEPLHFESIVDKHQKNDLIIEYKKLNSVLCIPIIFQEKMIGILTLGIKKSGENYTQEDIDVLSSLTRTEAIAISNAQLFQELSKTQAEAAQKEKMAVIGTLAAGINHEICNPLGIARGQCEMFLLNYRDGLYKDIPDKELVEKCVVIYDKVIQEVDRATGITKRLSSFAKPSKKFQLIDLNIAESIKEVLGILAYELRLDNIEVTMNVPENLPKMLGDKKQIEEIIFNIVRNAAQAINGRGAIGISAQEIAEKIILEIDDTGCGIPADKLSDIFNPFYTTKAPGKGTGLGLFIVKQVVERNKGTIAVQSEVGRGTKFTLSFEAAKQPVAA